MPRSLQQEAGGDFICAKSKAHTLRVHVTPAALSLLSSHHKKAGRHSCLREGVAPAAEFSLLKQYIMEGGAVLVLLAEGGEARTGTNINFLLEEFGMMVDSNCVIA